MKIIEASKEPTVQIGDTGLSGKALVQEEDQVGYTCYATFLDTGTNLDIKSIFGDQYNHIYYCISGEVIFKCNQGTEEVLAADSLIALNGKTEANIEVTKNTHLFIHLRKGKVR